MNVETKFSGSSEEGTIDSKEGKELRREKQEFIGSICACAKGWVLHRPGKKNPQIYKGTEASRWEGEETSGRGRVSIGRLGFGDNNL